MICYGLIMHPMPPSLNPPNRGNIVPNPNTGKITMTSGKPAPVTCTHMAEGHSKAVLSVYATDDLLFTSSKDRTAKAWDLQTGKEVMSFAGHPNNVLSVKYNELLNLVFTVSQSYINVWDYRMNATQCIKTLSSSGLTHDGPVNFQSGIRQSELPPGEHNINDIALGCDGYTLYSATGSMVRVWDLTTFSAIGKLNGGHQAAVMVLAVEQQKDNDVVITGSKDHYIKIFEVTDDKAGWFQRYLYKKWDLKTHTLKQSINQAHKDWICGLSFIPDSNIVLSGCRGGYLKLWNVDNCHCMGEVKAHTSPINAIATNGSAIFTASNDSAVKIWQFNRIQTLTTLWESGGPNPDWKPRTHQLSSPKSKSENYMYKSFNSIDTDCTDMTPHPGQIVKIYMHSIIVDGFAHPHYLAKVNWFQQLPDNVRHCYGKPIEVWSSDLYVRDGPAMFIPIQRIKCRFVHAKVKVGHRNVIVVSPRERFIL
ncbi:KIF21 [Mytilus edulis]|uniref:KIF21 n=1 Tax=Mytilus edulis TaxID=6550 RepID=A0A8S3S037_MYTED|nr:KIF21 [Mytilus edulis]